MHINAWDKEFILRTEEKYKWILSSLRPDLR